KFYVSQFKALNPQVKAVINDYVFGPKYFNLLKSLVDHGVPFDGIGQQSHQFWGNWSDRGLTNIIQRLSRLDKPITFTEVTTLAGPIRWELDFNRTYDDWFNTPDQEQRQANYLDFFYRLLYSYP
ncbi:MAG: endo-1,4-beta-xylanase, partial [Microcystaceae cyanobacterium]